MNHKQLSYFMEVYRCRNIQAAADKLYMTHQGLSRIIRALEEELGHPLFLRSNRGLEPTDFADSLVPHVQRLLDDYATIQGIDSLTSQKKATVTVYALDHVPAWLGVEFILRFHEQFPATTLSILDTTDEAALEALSAGRCDFAIVNAPVDPHRFTVEKLFFSRYCFRINKDDPLAERETIRPEDLRGRRLIGKGRAYRCFRTNIDRYLFESGISVDVPVETNDEELIEELVDRGLAIAVTYDFSAAGHCGENSVIRYPDDAGMGSEICLAERVGVLPSKAGRAFKRFLLAYVSEQIEQGRIMS